MESNPHALYTNTVRPEGSTRTIAYGVCSCGWRSGNSVNPRSVMRKHSIHRDAVEAQSAGVSSEGA